AVPEGEAVGGIGARREAVRELEDAAETAARDRESIGSRTLDEHGFVDDERTRRERDGARERRREDDRVEAAEAGDAAPGRGVQVRGGQRVAQRALAGIARVEEGIHEDRPRRLERA